MEGRLPDGWDSDAPTFDPDDGNVATRKASGEVIQWAAKQVPTLVSGSADLEPSTLTLVEDGGSVARGDFSGRNVHYGVREHAMGAIVNGLVLHGWRAFGSTFFNFLDYMKPAVRLASLMEIPSIFVFTHDSIGLGRGRPDAPAGRAARHAARAAEHVLRAAGRRERDRARVAVRHRAARDAHRARPEPPGHADLEPRRHPRRRDRPRRVRAARLVERTSPDADPDRHRLGAPHLRGGRRAARGRTASPRAWCRRRASTASPSRTRTTATSVLPRGVRARVSVEAASPLGWSTWVGDDGESIAMTTFGRPAPQPDLYEHFGFTPEKVAERARAVVERVSART